VNYAQPNPAESDVSDWLIRNPQRLNLARIGLDFGGKDVTEAQLTNKAQVLDLWTGKISSNFTYNNQTVEVETYCHPDFDAVGFRIKSELLASSDLGLFFDFPYPDKNKFDAPFVGVWNDTTHHNVSGYFAGFYASLTHQLDANSYFINAQWDSPASVTAPSGGSSRYVLRLTSDEVLFSVSFAPTGGQPTVSFGDIAVASKLSWKDYWESGAFVDLSGVKSPNATELQRRIILSQYLTAVNLASTNPPQGK